MKSQPVPNDRRYYVYYSNLEEDSKKQILKKTKNTKEHQEENSYWKRCIFPQNCIFWLSNMGIESSHNLSFQDLLIFIYIFEKGTLFCRTNAW